MTVTKGKHAAIYTRISRDLEGGGLGVARQLEDGRALAARLGLVVVAEYSDNDISAFSGRKRPGYEELLGSIQAGRVEAVICWNIDRLLRQTKELERYMDLCEPLAVATFEVTAGELDLTTPSGRATAKTRGAWAQYESEHKAERIRRQKAQAARAGKYLGGRVPWGWDQEKRGAIVVDPVAAEHIRAGTASVIAGRSLVSVTRAWADAGVLSLSGTMMNTTQVRRVLLRPRNAGLLTFHGEVVSDGWPAIVSLEEFRQCEAILTDKSRPRQSESKFKYLLSGVALCYCGRSMTGFGTVAKRSYRCKVHQEGGKYVRGHASRAMGPLDEHVLADAAVYLRREDVQGLLMGSLGELQDSARPAASADVAALVDRRHSLARMFAQGSITESQLVEGSQEIAGKLARLEGAAAARGGNAVLAALAVSGDPGAMLEGADVEVQREILRALFTIELLESGPHRGFFDESTVRMLPKALDGGGVHA